MSPPIKGDNMATKVGLGSGQWFEWEYNSTLDTLSIRRNPEANGSINITNQDVNIEGALASTTLVVNNGILAGTLASAGACIATSFTAGAFAGFTGTCPTTANLMVLGGIICNTS